MMYTKIKRTMNNKMFIVVLILVLMFSAKEMRAFNVDMNGIAALAKNFIDATVGAINKLTNSLRGNGHKIEEAVKKVAEIGEKINKTLEKPKDVSPLKQASQVATVATGATVTTVGGW